VHVFKCEHVFMSVNVPMCAHVVAVYCSFAVAGDGQLDEIEVLFRRGLKPCIAQLGNDQWTVDRVVVVVVVVV
jgi:hypothetical protein